MLLNGPVDSASVKDVIRQLREKDKVLPTNEPIYLILSTPGGSVLDGMDIVSMAQHLGTRYILQNGILMSHRMKTSISQGEVGGGLDEALAFAKVISREINKLCAERLSMEVEDYEKRISDEWWLYGQHAVNNKAADEVIIISCTDSLISVGKCPF